MTTLPPSPQGVLDRFSQIQPKLLFSVEAVVYNGREHSHLDKLQQVVKGMWPFWLDRGWGVCVCRATRALEATLSYIIMLCKKTQQLSISRPITLYSPSSLLQGYRT